MGLITIITVDIGYGSENNPVHPVDPVKKKIAFPDIFSELSHRR